MLFDLLLFLSSLTGALSFFEGDAGGVANIASSLELCLLRLVVDIAEDISARGSGNVVG